MSAGVGELRPPTELSPILRERLRSIADLTLAIDDLDDLLAALTRSIAAGLGIDVATILLLDDDGDELVVRASEGMREEVDAGLRIPIGQGIAGKTAESGRPQLLNDLANVTSWSPAIVERLASLVSVPLTVGSRVIGVLNVGSARPDAFDNDDVLLAELFGVRVAQAIDRLQIRSAERSVRADLAFETHSLEQLRRLLEELASAITADEVLEIALARAIAITDARRGTVVVTDNADSDRLRRIQRSDDEISEWAEALLSDSGASTMEVGSAGVVVVPDREAMREQFPVVLPRLHPDTVAWVYAPVLSRGGITGVMGLGFEHPIGSNPGFREALRTVGIQIGSALDRARQYDREHATAEQMRDLVRPGSIADIAGLEIEARCVYTEDIGGDWYAIDTDPTGGAVVAIGDVVGHGLAAAAGLTQIRVALRALVTGGLPVEQILSGLHRILEELPSEARFVTVAIIAFDPDRYAVRMLSAGHPSPLLVRSGRVTTIDVPPSPPLSDQLEAGPSTLLELDVEPGDLLVLYSDGVVERRGESIDVGIDRLRALLADNAGGALPGLADQLVGLADGTDDATVVLVRVAGLPSR